VEFGAPILITGPTGTGKSVFVSQLLNQELPQEKWTPIELAFSAKTTANQTQDIVDGKLGKRRKGIFGPPIGTKAVIFVDDVNMPEVEEYGAQPPIELLRQFLCQSGWFDNKEKTFTKIVDSQLICAMVGGAGRNEMTPRFLRHFSTLCITSFDDSTITRIFTNIMGWHFRVSQVPSSLTAMSTTLVEATLSMYRIAMSGLLPTPLKSHYTFNVRDFAKVMQGIVKFNPIQGNTPFAAITSISTTFWPFPGTFLTNLHIQFNLTFNSI
jgi:dynein heavy chain